MSRPQPRPGQRDPALAGNSLLSGLLVLIAIVLAVAGALGWGTARGMWAFLAAMALACLAGVEVAVREHLSGRRDHRPLLAGTASVLGASALMALGLGVAVALILGMAIFAATAALLSTPSAR